MPSSSTATPRAAGPAPTACSSHVLRRRHARRRRSPTTSASSGSPSRPPRSPPRSSSDTAAPAHRSKRPGSTSSSARSAWPLAFLGTVLVYFASRHTGGDADAALNWTALVAVAPRTSTRGHASRRRSARARLRHQGRASRRMHTWLPDAHSQAPAPVSALDVRRPAVGAVLRHAALQGRSPTCPRPGLPARPARRRRRPVTRRGRLAADRPTRLQTAPRLLQHRAHGTDRPRRRHRQPARCQRRPVPHPRSRPGQGRGVLRLGRDLSHRRHHRDRRRPRAPGASPACRRCLRARA